MPQILYGKQKVVAGGVDDSGQSWCEVNAIQDDACCNVSIKVSPSREMTWRTALVELTNGNHVYHISIRQRYAQQMRPSADYVQVNADSTTASIFVKTNVKPTISIPISATWLRLESIDVETLTIDQTITTMVYRFSLDRNRGLGRAVKVIFSGEDAQPVSVTIHQNPQTLRSEESINVDEPGMLGTLLGGNALEWANINTLHLTGQLNDADMQALRTLISPTVRYSMVNATGNVTVAFSVNLNLQHLDMGECQLVTGDGGLIIPSINANLDSYSNNGKNHLGDGAFKVTRTKLQSIILPETLESIGGWAFYYCESLEKLDIPASVTHIGPYAFSNCLSLSQINIPTHSLLKTIGTYAFSTGSRLTEMCFPASLQLDEFKSFQGNFSAVNIHVGWTVPPTLTRLGLQSTTTLYVPKGCGEAYRQAAGWNRAGKIVEE
ncbi:MAG: leucine-rich repeat domain-containing protein [Prevotella sp.]|nr:leucine-rich repeat domain-containing protein [Prevotella sp.]